jgi:uncharacterized protein
MIHPDTALRWIDERMGYGLVATRPIPRGTITWVGDTLDARISFARFRKLPLNIKETVDTYAYIEADGFVLCWDNARFVNHSCEANCLGPGHDFEFAVRDIAPGEQMLDDYGSMNLDGPFPCACGLPSCRKSILPDDLITFAPRWDAQIAAVLPRVRSVPQPLWALLSRGDRKAIKRACRGDGMLVSCRENYLGLIPELEDIWD